MMHLFADLHKAIWNLITPHTAFIIKAIKITIVGQNRGNCLHRHSLRICVHSSTNRVHVNNHTHTHTRVHAHTHTLGNSTDRHKLLTTGVAHVYTDNVHRFT